MAKFYVIKNPVLDDYLVSINLGAGKHIMPMYWRGIPRLALHFENSDIAQATITFIGDVLDWELAEQLEIVEVETE